MTFVSQGVSAYQREAVQAAHYASPHQLVSMLMDGALERIVQARAAMERQLTARKGERIGKAISIIDSLRASLNQDRGGEVAANLAALYDYMVRRLLHANLNNDPDALDEVQRLLKEIKAGWDGIAEQTARAAS
ncbi:MAG TPA: flagellar export chaperone FliS [Pseudomonadales bacterium]